MKIYKDNGVSNRPLGLFSDACYDADVVMPVSRVLMDHDKDKYLLWSL